MKLDISLNNRKIVGLEIDEKAIKTVKNQLKKQIKKKARKK